MVFYSHSSFNGCRLSDGISKRNSPRVQNYRVLPSSDQLRLSNSLQLLSSHFPFPPSSVTAASDPNDLLAFLPMPEEMLETYWCHFSMWCVYLKIYMGSDILRIPDQQARTCSSASIPDVYLPAVLPPWHAEAPYGTIGVPPSRRLVHHLGAGRTHRQPKADEICGG